MPATIILSLPLPPQSSSHLRFPRPTFINNNNTLSSSALLLLPLLHNQLLKPKPSIVRLFRPVNCTKTKKTQMEETPSLDCVGTGLDVECLAGENDEEKPFLGSGFEVEKEMKDGGRRGVELGGGVLNWVVLVSPFFFWGTSMVAMKGVLPKAGPFFVASVRLIPAGLMLIGYGLVVGKRKLPEGVMAWAAILLFGLVDASCFQGFLAEGLQRTSAGLGSVIIDSQPLTVAILAALLFGESIGIVGAAGLALGVVGLLLLELPALSNQSGSSTIWGSGEWWMLLAAQSMAIGTVMVRWVSKYSDPVMATGWHMVLGGLPLLAISVVNKDPAMTGSIGELTPNDFLALAYTSFFGSAVSYGVYFYNATRGSLTKLSSLTFLTPMFASIFGYLYLDEKVSDLQLVGALITLLGIFLVNYRPEDARK